jgi:DNA-binding MarR family transcriptional regulator
MRKTSRQTKKSRAKLGGRNDIQDQARRPSATDLRHQSIGRFLRVALRQFDERVVELVRKKGYTEDRLIFHSVTRHLDFKGTRLTELARRAAMTKQAMSELVDQSRRFGMVTQKPDPTDRRARLVIFTPRGRKWLDDIGRALRQAENEMRKRIGTKQMVLMHKALADYCGAEVADLSDDTSPRREGYCRVDEAF